MKIAFVVQRYGLEVNGGAEHHCRMLAEHLSKYYDVEVITTCAKDYTTWRDEYEPGKEEVNGIAVWRFQVDWARDLKKFNLLSERIFSDIHKDGEESNIFLANIFRSIRTRREIHWMKRQGPYSTGLLKFIKQNKNKYDCFIFFTYLYCTTFFGLPLVRDKAILVPTAHDESAIYLSIFASLFRLPRAIVYNTHEERDFINKKFNNKNILSDVIGVGIDVPENIDPEDFKQKYNITDFIIYAGRIEEAKGCQELFENFIKYKKEVYSNIKLVLLGKQIMKIPSHPDIIPLGFIPDQDKFNGIKAAKLLIMPSKYESLSMVIMESWLCSNVVLVNGDCEVLKGHVKRSHGGLWYQNYDEFKECLTVLLSDEELRSTMGRKGKKYVEDSYSWKRVEDGYQDLLAQFEQRPAAKH